MIEFTEDRIPSQGLAEAVDDLVELFGGDMQASREGERHRVHGHSPEKRRTHERGYSW